MRPDDLSCDGFVEFHLWQETILALKTYSALMTAICAPPQFRVVWGNHWNSKRTEMLTCCFIEEHVNFSLYNRCKAIYAVFKYVYINVLDLKVEMCKKYTPLNKSKTLTF